MQWLFMRPFGQVVVCIPVAGCDWADAPIENVAAAKVMPAIAIIVLIEFFISFSFLRMNGILPKLNEQKRFWFPGLSN